MSMEGTVPIAYSVLEDSVFAVDGEVCAVRGLDAADDPGIDAERLAYVDYLPCIFLWQINLEAVAAVEYLVHLFPLSAALLLNGAEQRWDGKEVILDYMYAVNKVQDLGLCTA